MFNLLSVPYMNMRMAEMNLKNKKRTVVSDLEKKAKYIEYPEEISEIAPTQPQKLDNILKDKSLREKFFEGVTYEKDAAPESSD
jgi:hypothetical protein